MNAFVSQHQGPRRESIVVGQVDYGKSQSFLRGDSGTSHSQRTTFPAF
jgi:hypothetical protein